MTIEFDTALPSKLAVLTLAAVLLLTRPTILLARDAPGNQDWAAVRSMPPGAELLVETKDGKRVKGKLSSVSDTTLTLTRKKGSTSIDRAGVQSVLRLSRGSRVTSTLIGAGLGAGTGVGIGFAALYATGGSDEAGALVLICLAVAAGIGAAVGAAAGPGVKRALIYQSR